MTKKDIPYYAQIIHIADVFDAIVSKRQYKTHVNISETLKLLIKEAHPSMETIALDVLATDSKYGKINPKILNILFKVVIDDTLYEISCTMEYIQYLKSQLKRLKKIQKFDDKLKNSKTEKNKEYYRDYINLLLESGETLDNYKTVTSDYEKALETKKQLVDKLDNEIHIIKRLNPYQIENLI